MMSVFVAHPRPAATRTHSTDDPCSRLSVTQSRRPQTPARTLPYNVQEDPELLEATCE